MGCRESTEERQRSEKLEDPAGLDTPVKAEPQGGNDKRERGLRSPMDFNRSENSSPSNRSFNTTDMGSFRSNSFVNEKGDAVIDRAGTMRASRFKTVSEENDEEEEDSVTASALGRRRLGEAESVPLSSHSSDNELVLACLDCGTLITDSLTEVICPLTGKLHA